MSIISAYQEVGTYRGAAVLRGTTHKTVKRVIHRFEAEQAGFAPAARATRRRTFNEIYIPSPLAAGGGKSAEILR